MSEAGAAAPWPIAWENAPVTFDEVYERLRGPVWRLALRFCRDREEALDATQEVFLRVWRALPGFRGEAQVSTWVYRIAWNVLLSRARRERRRAARAVELPLLEAEMAQRLRDPAPDPERRAEAADELAQVAAAIARLPEPHRAVLWLRDGEGLTYAEIARALDVPLGTVRSRLARARELLRRAMEDPR